MISLLAAFICVGILLFCLICLVAWFCDHNRPINLGGKRK
jgi:hypothetical protein